MRTRDIAVAAVALMLCFARAAGQDSNAPTGPAPLVVQVSTELVQVDAVVTDNEGRYVTDLQSGDFELSEDGKRREVTNFRYVSTAAHSPASAGGTPVAAATRAATTRTLAIVVDDLSLSFENSVYTRKALSKLIEEQLGPGDQAAIVRTSGGNGNLQQFTNDKRLLAAAAEGIPFNLARLGTLAPGAAPSHQASSGSAPAAGADAAIARASASLQDLANRMDRNQEVHATLGTLNALQTVVDSLARMPGRKSLLFLSEGLFMTDATGDKIRAQERLLTLIDAANRASVVFYTVDPAGLRVRVGRSASDPASLESPEQKPFLAGPLTELRGASAQLAFDTGGLALGDNNDLGEMVKRVFDDQQGYYLLGYQPDASSFSKGDAPARFHRLQVKVTRLGLHVRSRRGFYARADSVAGQPKVTSLADALASPFAAVDIPVRLTPLFRHDPQLGTQRASFLRCLVHVDASTLTLHEEADGSRTAEVEAGVLSLADGGRIAEHVGGKHTLHFPAATAGLVMTIEIPVEPGPYQIRAAVRDVATGRTGSASQFVDVPDLRTDRLALSGISMSGLVEVAQTTASSAAFTDESVDPDATPAVRRFRSGASLTYAFDVYKARTDKTDGKPRLTAYLSLFRDGKRVQTVPIRTDDTLPARAGVSALAGALRLGPQMQPGTYTLEVIVQDTLRGAKTPPAIQWIDFDIVG